MCGIIGYVGNEQAARSFWEGYASSISGLRFGGIATISDNCIHVGKDKGKLDDVACKCDLISLQGQVGIGHVRWATHGGATKRMPIPTATTKTRSLSCIMG